MRKEEQIYQAEKCVCEIEARIKKLECGKKFSARKISKRGVLHKTERENKKRDRRWKRK
jgi:hypothetical protein